jgi:hypothetical protein
MISFILELIILYVTSYIYCCQIEEDKMNEDCSTDGRNEKLMRISVKPTKRIYVIDLGFTINLILQK